jgi:hypothetical protein
MRNGSDGGMGDRPLSTQKLALPTNCLRFRPRTVRESSARLLGSHSKDSTSLSCEAPLKVRTQDSLASDPDPNCSQPLRGR